MREIVRNDRVVWPRAVRGLEVTGGALGIAGAPAKHPKHRVDGDDIAALGKRALADRAGLGEPPRRSGRHRLADCRTSDTVFDDRQRP